MVFYYIPYFLPKVLSDIYTIGIDFFVVKNLKKISSSDRNDNVIL